jgi:hypothetical protein
MNLLVHEKEKKVKYYILIVSFFVSGASTFDESETNYEAGL